jgi:hypothetical protein
MKNWTALWRTNMPASSEKQKKFMDAAAHNPKFAKAAGVPQNVAKDFSEKSKGLKFGAGTKSRADLQKVNKPKTLHGKSQLFKEGGETMDKKDIKQDKAIVKKAVTMHDKQLHGGKKTNLAKLAKGGGVESKGKTKGKMIAMCGGGMAKKK